MLPPPFREERGGGEERGRDEDLEEHHLLETFRWTSSKKLMDVNDKRNGGVMFAFSVKSYLSIVVIMI